MAAGHFLAQFDRFALKKVAQPRQQIVWRRRLIDLKRIQSAGAPGIGTHHHRMARAFASGLRGGRRNFDYQIATPLPFGFGNRAVLWTARVINPFFQLERLMEVAKGQVINM